MYLVACFIRTLTVLFFFGLLSSCSDSSSHSAPAEATLGSTPLTTERVNLDPDIVVNKQLAVDNAARQYLAAALPEHVDYLEVSDIHYSLLASHVAFEYVVNDTPLWGCGATVSVDMATGKILRSFFEMPDESVLNEALSAVVAKVSLDVEQAKEASWQHIGVSGELLSPLQCDFFYRQYQEQLIPAYRVLVHVSEPYGHWRVWVNGYDGTILSVESVVIPCKPIDLPDFSLSQGAIVSREDSEQALVVKSSPLADLIAYWQSLALSGYAGEGQIFDPDPRTVLGDEDLSLDSPLVDFELAYTTVTLNNISQTVDGDYRLCGPHVCIEDFDPPETPPSTTTDGIWDAPRGEPAFWEAMIYHHIDSCQRYLQSLGYIDERSVVDLPIVVDADGAFGYDNSFFDPQNNTLSFGRGGVPDAEDADVILHEYGHALQYATSPIMYGGDWGAIAEGSSDYWAASWGLRTEAGQDFQPNRVFQWDGLAWGGRSLDAAGVWYDPSKTYTAHQSFLVEERPDFGSFTDEDWDNWDWDNWNHESWLSDELWSRPLYLSLQRLLAAGYPRSDMDMIVLESFFGLGTKITMREQARIFVSTAQHLYPNHPHAEILQQEFEAVNILDNMAE